ncbi:hypothetical protein PHET_11482 [Paragonimus heterotremus]|uniref:Uncharacterized protein n=1 Tax=Paragonimus heterotremus TaxID=100268 RepID=A0A8J4SN90_9TREM|nr:hypothetical protein PHET_11482 [Paragonimus heterotremus]
MRKKPSHIQTYPLTSVDLTELYIFVPFHFFFYLVLSLCYLYDDPVMLYMVFRELYIRYFHKLHTISNDCSGVLSLCILFERLLQVREPQLFFHLRSHGIQP